MEKKTGAAEYAADGTEAAGAPDRDENGVWDLKRLKKSADEGDGRACALVGLVYIKGRITVDGHEIRARTDDEKAVRYLWRAANLGNYDHAFYLANAYYGGIGIAPDTERAIRLYDLCALTGSSSSGMSRAAFLRCADPDRLQGDVLRRWQAYRREETRKQGAGNRRGNGRTPKRR